MNKKQLLDKVKAELKELEKKVGKLNEEELSIFILWKLIEEKSFDSQYFFGSKMMREKIYQLEKAKSSKKPNGQEETKRNLICVSMSAEYKYIAEELGLSISLEKVSYSDESNNGYDVVNDLKTGDHLFNIVHCSNGKKIKIDVQKEIARMQIKSMPQDIYLDFDKNTQLFMRLRYSAEEEKRKKQNQEKIDLILRKIGYIGEGEQYTDELCKDIIDSSEDCSEAERVRKIIEDPIIQSRFNKSRISELYRAYRKILKYMVNFENTVVMPCYVEKEFEKRQYSLCIYTETKNDTGIWIYSRKSNKMERIDLETMKFFVEKGLTFVTDTAGDDYKLKRFIASMNEKMDFEQDSDSHLLEVEDILELE